LQIEFLRAAIMQYQLTDCAPQVNRKTRDIPGT
jgi:hypothetical protein